MFIKNVFNNIWTTRRMEHFPAVYYAGHNIITHKFDGCDLEELIGFVSFIILTPRQTRLFEKALNTVDGLDPTLLVYPNF